MTKIVWKPQTKKLAVRSQKPVWRVASASAAPIDCSLSASAALRPASAAPSGMMKKASTPMVTSAFSQPKPAMSACAPGSMANWPNEPQAPTMPTARLRFSGGNARATTPITTPKALHESAKPSRTPAAMSRPSGEVECAMAIRPLPYASPPAANTRPAP